MRRVVGPSVEAGLSVGAGASGQSSRRAGVGRGLQRGAIHLFIAELCC